MDAGAGDLTTPSSSPSPGGILPAPPKPQLSTKASAFSIAALVGSGSRSGSGSGSTAASRIFLSGGDLASPGDPCDLDDESRSPGLVGAGAGSMIVASSSMGGLDLRPCSSGSMGSELSPEDRPLPLSLRDDPLEPTSTVMSPLGGSAIPIHGDNNSQKYMAREPLRDN